MARSNMVSLSSSCMLVLAMIMASLSLTPVASQNFSSILNGVTDATEIKQLYFVGCSYIFDTSRFHEPVKTVLPPGAEYNITIDKYPGVKQVECDITRYAPTTSLIFHMKVVVWFFAGPAVTRCKFLNNDMLFALLPDLTNFNQGTGMVWTFDDEYVYTPNFFTSGVPYLSSSK